MNIQDQFKSIIQAMEAQDNETVQQAQQAYIDLIINLREAFYFIHLDLLMSMESQESKKVLVLLGSYFSILFNQKIIISETSIPEIQNSLFSLFQIETFQDHHFDIISSIIYKAARYFKDNWPELPEYLFQLFNNSNPYIISVAVQCLSDCINEKYIDIGPFYENIVTFIQNSLSEPNESTTITIIPILRLLYSIVDYIDQEEQNEVFKPIINLIPNYLQFPQKDSIMINDLFLFARYHQNLFSDSFHNFFESLMKIIEDIELGPEIINSAIYCLFSIIPNYSKNYQSQSCMLFDFFCTKLNDSETYDAAIYSIIVLSDMYGAIEEYGQHIFSYLESNAPNPSAYISFSVSYKRIKNQNNNGHINDLLNIFSQGFTSEINTIRLESFQSFWPLIEIFNQSDDDFNYEDLVLLLLKIIQSEVEVEILAVEIKVLSKILKFYSPQLQQNIEEIVKMLDYIIENCKDHKVIVNTIKCYIHILTSYDDAKFLTLSQFYDKILSEATETNEETEIEMNDEKENFFFNCMKFLPCFINSFPDEIYANMNERLFQILFNAFDENRTKRQKEEEENENEDFIFINEKPLIMKFFLRCIEKNSFFNSSEIIEKVKTIAFEIFEEKPKFDFIPENFDLDLTECCIIIPAQVENKSIIISYEQMAMYEDSLTTIIMIFKKFPDLIPFNFESLFKLTKDFLKSILKPNLYIQIFDLQKLIVPFIQNEEQLTYLVEKTLDKEIVHEYDHFELKKLTELMFEFLNCTIEKWKNKIDFIEKIVEFVLHVLACLEIENEDKKEDGLIFDDNDDQNLFNVKIQYALLIRETFRYYQQFSVDFFDELTFNIINDIQINNDSNKVIAAIVFSDFIHLCNDENESYWSMFFELFTSYFENQNLNVKLSSIYGLSIIANPNYMDADSLNNLIDMFIQNLQDNFNNETCSMVIFAFLQIFQNYSSTIDISVYLQQFWDLVNGKTFEIPDYCYEYMAQSLLFFITKKDNLIPKEKVQDLSIIIQNLLDKSKDASLDEQLKSILISLDSK